MACVARLVSFLAVRFGSTVRCERIVGSAGLSSKCEIFPISCTKSTKVAPSSRALDSSTELWTMPTSNHQRQQRRAAARRAAVATDDVPDAVPRPKGRGPRNHFWDPRPPGVRRHNESNEPNQRRAARLASARGRHADAVRGRRWSRINAARCNEAKSFQAPASSASWRGLHGPSRRPGGR